MAKHFPVPGLALCVLLLIGLALGCEGEESTTPSSDRSDDDRQSGEQSALIPGIGSGDDSQSTEQSALVPGLIPGQTTADPAVTPSPTPVALPPGYYDGAEHGLALAQTSRRPSPNREGWVDITLSLVAVKLGGGQLGLERGESNSLCFSFGDCFLVKWGSEEQFEAELRVAFERGSGDTGPHGPRGPKSVNLTATFQVAGNAGNANLYFGDHKIPLDLQGDYSLSANHASPLPAPSPLASQDPKTANFFMDAEHGIAVTGVYRQVDPAEPLDSWVRVELEVLPLGGYDAPDAEGGLHVEAGSVCLGNDGSECLEIFWGPKNQFNAPLSLDRDDNRAFVEARRSGARWPLPLTVGFRAPHNQDDAELMFGEHSIPLDLRGMTGDPAFDYTAHYPGAMSGALLYESDGKTVVLDSITQNPDTGNLQLALTAKNDNEAEDFTPAVDTAVFSTVGKLDVTGGKRPVAFETMAPGQSASLATVIPYAGNAQWGYVIYSSESPRRPHGIVVQVREDGGAQSSRPVFISFGGMALTGSWPPPPVSAPISSGLDYTCALREDGAAVCWGSNGAGQASPPAGETFTALSSGDYHTCALREDGSAVCWGSDDEGQASPPEGETFAAVSSGDEHTCGLRADRTAVCWGSGRDGRASPPAGETFAAISSGGYHTCALREDGAAVCWGDDEYGQTSPPEGETFTAVSSGFRHTCGLREDGAAVCWGDDEHGQASPPEGEAFTAVSSGGAHTCGLREDGAAVCWGSNEDYEGNFLGQASPPAGETFAAISSGWSHTCGLRADGAAVCWGDDRVGQASPPGGEPFTALSSGGWHTCGLREDGAAVCWGDNEHGQASPPEGETFTALSSGYLHTCGLREDGAAVCWGDDRVGQASPPGGEPFTALSSGEGHTCALREDGVAVCWGWNEDGQASPPTGETFTALSSGNRHTCGLREDGAAVCWGDNSHGQASPPEGETFTALSSGWDHTCGLREDGAAVCWGDDRHGRASPPEGETFTALSSGYLHTCGLREDGAAVCWGYDEDGPASPPEGETFTALSSGDWHTCGLRADGGIVCWGGLDSIIPSTSSVARPPVTGPARVSAADRIALDAFYDAAGGDGWTNGERGSQGGWSAGSDVRGWHGVTVSETTGRVTGLALPGNNLNNDAGNRALAMLGNLTALTRLDLSGNDLGGALPPELDQLTQLTHLDLSGNAFRGDIHSESTEFQDGPHRDIEWENLQNLVELDLSWNKRCGGLLPGCRHGLSGWIGGFILLPNLDKLDLSGNELHSGAQYLLENAPAMDAEDAGEPVQIDLSDNPWDTEPEDLREYWTGFKAEVTRGFVDLGRLVVNQKYPIDGVENPKSVGAYLAGKLNEGITGRAVVHSTMTGKWAGTAAWLVRGSKLVVTAGTGVGWVVFCG